MYHILCWAPRKLAQSYPHPCVIYIFLERISTEQKSVTKTGCRNEPKPKNYGSAQSLKDRNLYGALCEKVASDDKTKLPYHSLPPLHPQLLSFFF